MLVCRVRAASKGVTGQNARQSSPTAMHFEETLDKTSLVGSKSMSSIKKSLSALLTRDPDWCLGALRWTSSCFARYNSDTEGICGEALNQMFGFKPTLMLFACVPLCLPFLLL